MVATISSTGLGTLNGPTDASEFGCWYCRTKDKFDRKDDYKCPNCGTTYFRTATRDSDVNGEIKHRRPKRGRRGQKDRRY